MTMLTNEELKHNELTSENNTELVGENQTDTTPSQDPNQSENLHLSPEQGVTLKDVAKQVPVGELTQDLREKLSFAVQALAELKVEIESKKTGALEKKNFIKDKIASLRDSGKVNIDENEFKKSEGSVEHFVQLLDKMMHEVDNDGAFYVSLLSDKQPETMYAFNFEPDDFQKLITRRIQSIKKYVKDAKRDLSISYSRYCFGFETQIRQITYVEHVLNNLDTNTPSKA
jgi:hypothetical protein